MGYAKYHEDDLGIFDERMYLQGSPDILTVVRRTDKIKAELRKYYAYCPFCGKGFVTADQMIAHIYDAHGRKYDFIYLNNSLLSDKQSEVDKIYSLKLYCFYNEPKRIVITDDFDRKYFVDTVNGRYEYDLTNVLKGKLFSYLKIDIPGKSVPFEIQQYLDMAGASIDNILQDRYKSDLFDVRISNNMLNVDECLTYMKMLIHEKEDAEPFVQRVDSFHFDKSRELTELYWYYWLYKGELDASLVDDSLGKFSTWLVLHKLLLGEYAEAEKLLVGEKRRDEAAIGLRLILAILKNDIMAIDYNKKLYKSYGIIGIISKALMYIHSYEDSIRENISTEIKELSLFSKYPLVQAILDCYGAETTAGSLSKDSYNLLRAAGPIVAILHCKGIKDKSVVEKIIKSNVKIHPKSKLLKNEALNKNFAWIGRRIAVADGDVYRRKLDAENQRRLLGFSRNYLDEFPYDDEISITPLGGEAGIGASCFVVSYKGFNIMLDAGINPKQKDDASYPELDRYDGRIDMILLSHAHIDHSGGIPKAHAMWQDARILMTKPTKVLLKFIYSDMARVKNGISDDFEIENVNITKEVMSDTFQAISTVDYEDIIHVSSDIEVVFHKAGHIVGAAMIELRIAGKTILYTGDFTDYDQNFVSGFNFGDMPKNVDYLITEATYISGNSFSRYEQSENIKNEIKANIEAGKSVLLAGASIGRCQELVCILGEMLEDKQIPDGYELYLAGMAIPTTTQLIPFFNDSYGELLSNFTEFDGVEYPKEKTIVVASSGTMKKGSASYKIEKHWLDYDIRHNTILGGYADEDTEYDYDDLYHSSRVRMPLSTHAGKSGIEKLIDYTKPKVMSIVHQGAEKRYVEMFAKDCIKSFANDLHIASLIREKKVKIFDLLEQIMEES